MKFTKLAIPDVILIEPRIFDDPRGFFFESYRKDLFEKNGIPVDFVQDNHVRSTKGVLRGLHFQLPPKAQAKLVRVLAGSVYDVAVDIRKDSPSYGKYVGIILKAEEKKMLYIPAGFAHGYLTLESNTEVFYKCSNVYAPELEGGIIWNDPAVAIAWPKLDRPFTLSEKDQKYPRLKTAAI